MKFRYEGHTFEFGKPRPIEEATQSETLKVLRIILVDGVTPVTWKSSEDVFLVSCFEDVLTTAKTIRASEGPLNATD